MAEEVEVLIMGAGIQGCSTALELGRRGVNVALLDQDSQPMNRASLRNEGKVHLGLVYANDSSMETALLQLSGALSFWPLLKSWLGGDLAQLAVSNPFHYLVAPDSLMSPESLERHYGRVKKACAERLAVDPNLNYLGRRPDRLYRRLDEGEIGRHFNSERITAAFATQERSISSEQLAVLYRNAIRKSRQIDFRPGRRIESIRRRAGGFQIDGTGRGGEWSIGARQVVNATWEGRLRLDRQMGLYREGWLYRLKYRVIVQIPNDLQNAPSATMVLGPYGDVVIRPDGTAYLSWYPTAMRGWSHDIIPPATWDSACRGMVSSSDARQIAAEMLQAIAQWFPGIAASSPVQVDAGIIVAYGTTDVDNQSSGLHRRSQVGVTSVDGYHSLDAGKLTTSPLFATIAADRVISA